MITPSMKADFKIKYRVEVCFPRLARDVWYALPFHEFDTREEAERAGERAKGPECTVRVTEII